MAIKDTCFGRHYKHCYCDTVSRETKNGTMFNVHAPNKGLIISDTVHTFLDNALQYAYVQQLHHCNACIVTTSCVHSRGHFNSTMRLVSYDTVVCEVSFYPHSMVENGSPYCSIIIGEHWNYSRTTVQHVYKFLRMFGITNVSISDYAKRDARASKDVWNSYIITNNVGNNIELRFCSARAITDFAYNNAQRFVERMIKG